MSLKGALSTDFPFMIQPMKTIMKLDELKTIEQLTQLLDGTQAVIFELSRVKKNTMTG
jgi:hypothetical protein